MDFPDWVEKVEDMLCCMKPRRTLWGLLEAQSFSGHESPFHTWLLSLVVGWCRTKVGLSNCGREALNPTWACTVGPMTKGEAGLGLQLWHGNEEGTRLSFLGSDADLSTLCQDCMVSAIQKYCVI